MTRFRRTTLLSLVLASALLLGLAQAALALTEAGIAVSSTAKVDYKVNGADQSQISTSISFDVDEMVKPVVVDDDADDTQVIEVGATAVAVQFTVTNEGNADRWFKLAGVAQSSPNFTATVKIYKDGSTAGWGGDETEITADPEILLTHDGTNSQRVFLVFSSPTGTLTHGTSVDYYLVATALTGDNGTPLPYQDQDGTAWKRLNASDDPATAPQLVYADGDGPAAVSSADADTTKDGDQDARHSAIITLELATGCLSQTGNIAKTVSVISDPYSSTNPKAIPGAILEYTITLDNTDDSSSGTACATVSDVQVTDDLSAKIGTELAWKLGAYTGGKDIHVKVDTTDYYYDSAAISDPDFGEIQSNILKVTNISLADGKQATVKFQVEIK